MSNEAMMEQFKQLTKGWPQKPVAAEAQRPAPETKEQEPAKEPAKEPAEAKEDNLSGLSDRERGIVLKVMESLDFAQLLVNDYLEADVPVRGGLVLRFRSPRANSPFRYQEYVARKRRQADKDAEEAEKMGAISRPFIEDINLRTVWTLADGLVSINESPFMPGAGDEHMDHKISRLLEKSKHVLDQFIWGQNLFDFALREVCDSDGLGEQLKNS